MATQDRTPRDVETRVFDERPKQWMPAELLPEPDRQAGYVYRWIRVSTLNNADPRNLSSKLREGWEPVKISEQPKLQLLAEPGSRFKDNIEIGGLLLCKCPETMNDQRNDYFSSQAQNQMDAVDNSFMRQNDARMPLFSEKKSTVTRGFGKGK